MYVYMYIYILRDVGFRVYMRICGCKFKGLRCAFVIKQGEREHPYIYTHILQIHTHTVFLMFFCGYRREI